jgi:hypothetical protein
MSISPVVPRFPIYFLRKKSARAIPPVMTMKEVDSIMNQAAPTPASLLSHDAAHIFDNAAVEFQLSADREEMVAPGTIYRRI